MPNGSAKDHETYCEEMIKKGYSLVKITPLGGLDDRRDSYEGTLVYQWKKFNRMVHTEELN